VAQCGAGTRPKDWLPSWNDGDAKRAIVDFVRRVTEEGGPDFVPPTDRVAVFDNDGTLCSEKPFYFQGMLTFDLVHAMLDQHPEWRTTQPFQAVVEGDWQALAEFGTKGLLKLVMATHTGMTTDEFNQTMEDWLGSAQHPQLQRPYTELVFQPMLEVLDYLRASAFRTFIVSASGIDFIRVFCEQVYGIARERVVGSSGVTRYEVRDGVPVLVRLPEVHFLDDGEAKPAGIHEHIGRRPIAAFGNSDGDIQMLEWVTAGTGARLGVILHHDDAEREFAYDRHSPSGQLDRALTEAPARGWTVVSMKRDWSRVFPPPS
jgi:phosphoglycolate phosphatase-like HAD superfamily hydrolase